MTHCDYFSLTFFLKTYLSNFPTNKPTMILLNCKYSDFQEILFDSIEQFI